MSIRVPVHLVLASLLACCSAGQDDSSAPPCVSEDQPDILLEPDLIDFGAVAVLEQGEHVELVTVTNQGSADLHISNLSIEDSGAPFTISAIQSMLVMPGASTQFEVIYDPATASIDATRILIDSDDPNSPAQLMLLGEGIAPVIELSPAPQDFGEVTVGCEREQSLVILNQGSEELVVYDATFAAQSSLGDELLFGGLADGNGDDTGLLTLAPSEHEIVWVSYLPLDESQDIATLTISSNDPFDPLLEVELEGLGAFHGTQLDSFEQPTEGAVDVIFALDTSGSMNTYASTVLDNLEVFTTTLLGQDIDFHVAVTRADDGCINGSDIWVDDSFASSDVGPTIETMVNLAGAYASNTERAFTLMEATLTETGSGGCNEGLVRDHAVLNLVGISDEPEQSPNSWSYYLTLFQSYKSDPDDVIVHAVGGDNPGGCGSASAYTGMYEATVATGGQFVSICAADWATSLAAVAEDVARSMDSFELSEEAVSGTLVVRVDGVSMTEGWSYDEDRNALVFDNEYVPDGGATIEVEYAVRGDCG